MGAIFYGIVVVLFFQCMNALFDPVNRTRGGFNPFPSSTTENSPGLAIGIAPTPMILLNGWLADGLLLYRCYVIYARNYWVIIFPCLVFLASLCMYLSPPQADRKNLG